MKFEAFLGIGWWVGQKVWHDHSVRSNPGSSVALAGPRRACDPQTLALRQCLHPRFMVGLLRGASLELWLGSATEDLCEPPAGPDQSVAYPDHVFAALRIL